MKWGFLSSGVGVAYCCNCQYNPHLNPLRRRGLAAISYRRKERFPPCKRMFRMAVAPAKTAENSTLFRKCLMSHRLYRFVESNCQPPRTYLSVPNNGDATKDCHYVAIVGGQIFFLQGGSLYEALILVVQTSIWPKAT